MKHRIVPVVVCIVVAITAAVAVLPSAARAQGVERALEVTRQSAITEASIMASAAIDALVAEQHPSGAWGVTEGRPALPAITGLVLTGMLLDPDADRYDDAIRAAIDSILSYQQPDGGIYDRILPSYNTSICVSALALARGHAPDLEPRASAAIDRALPFLRGLQWGETASLDPALGDSVARVGPDHPFYGGVGYGSSGRPDNSNLNLWIQALHDAGVPGDDPAIRRALAFLARTQMLDEINDMPYARGSTQGGFIYATSPNADELGIGESKAGLIEETLSTGETASRLRAYGSMTYAGFKSFAYAQLEPDDPRVTAARRWIESTFTLDENPGLGTDGQYYYYMVFARSLRAWDSPLITDRTGPNPIDRRWDVHYVRALMPHQATTGLFSPVDDRWLESDPVLITAYALIGLQHARESLQLR